MKKDHKTVLFAKTKLNTTKIFISKPLIDSYIDHEEFLSVDNLSRKYNEMKEEIKNLENAVQYTV